MDATSETKLSKREPRVIVVEGEIGAGKTTILSALADAFRAKGLTVAVAPEPVDEWLKVGILKRFYQDPTRYAYEFQTYTFVTRIIATLECVKKNPSADIYLLERSVLTDRHVFMELQRSIVGEETMQMYDAWFGLHARLMPFDLSKATYLYLKPDLKECMTRVATRARQEETKSAPDKDESADVKSTIDSSNGKGGVSLEYQARLRVAHEVLFEGRLSKDIREPAVRPFPLTAVVVVEGDLANGDFTESGSKREAIAKELVSRLGG